MTPYTFESHVGAVPLGVRVPSEAALQSPSQIWVTLPGAGFEYEMGMAFGEWWADLAGLEELGDLIFVGAQASDALAPFWSLSATYHVEHLESLFEALGGSFCLDRSTVVLFGVGQGTLAAAQAICQGELPVDLAVFVAGIVAMEECAPQRPVPLVTIDMFEFREPWGNHWDGNWNPPPAIEIDLTGGIGPGPDEFASWERAYGCAETAVDETLPDPGDVLERDTILLSNDSCDAGLVAFAVQNNRDVMQGMDNAALDGLRDRLAEEMRRVLEG